MHASQLLTETRMKIHEKVRQIYPDGMRDTEILAKIVNLAKSYFVNEQEKCLPFVSLVLEEKAMKP